MLWCLTPFTTVCGWRERPWPDAAHSVPVADLPFWMYTMPEDVLEMCNSKAEIFRIIIEGQAATYISTALRGCPHAQVNLLYT